jgi:hypothetical protein
VSQSTGSLSSKFWLSFLPQPPRHPFARVYFPLKVVLVDSKRVLKPGWLLQLHVELLYENGEVVPEQKKHVEVYGHDDARPIILTETLRDMRRFQRLPRNRGYRTSPSSLKSSSLAGCP